MADPQAAPQGFHVQLSEQDGLARISARNAVLLAGRAPDGGDLPDTFKAGELLLGALGTCIQATVRAFAKNHGIAGLKEVQVAVHGEETPAPARISRLEVVLTLLGGLSAEERIQLLRAAGACKLHNTLSRGAEIRITAGQDAGQLEGAQP